MSRFTRFASKTTVAITTAAVLFSVGGLVTAYQASAANQPYTSTVNLNVRTGPGTTYGILGVLRPGDTVQGRGAQEGDWMPVTYNGANAYVYASYLTSSVTTSSVPATDSIPAGVKVTTVNLNVRTGPGTTYQIVAVAPKGTLLPLTGRADGQWVEVTYQSANRWVFAGYLATPGTTLSSQMTPTPTPTSTTVASADPSPSATATPASTTPPATATAAPASTSTPTSSPTTDPTSTPVTVTPPATTAPSQNTVGSTVQGKTTAALNLREAPSVTSTAWGVLPADSIVDLTGNASGNYSEILYNDAKRWILTGYITVLSDPLTATPLPTATGEWYLNADQVYVRASASITGDIVTTLTYGTMVQVTGVVENGYTQIIYSGALRWMASQYLSPTPPPPSTGGTGNETIDRLNAYAKQVVTECRDNFPQIATIYGWRAYGGYSSDHTEGRAVDMMLPDYLNNEALGWQIAKYFQANAARLHITYIIFHQSIWMGDPSDLSWRPMADRGSDTENHIDHVHVSVQDVPAV